MGATLAGGTPPRNKEFTPEEIEKIEETAKRLRQEAEEKEICAKAMEIVITTEGEPVLFRSPAKSFHEGNITIELKRCEASQREGTQHSICVIYRARAVFRCGKSPLQSSRHGVSIYHPGEWEEELFGLYNKLPEYRKRKEERERQGKASMLASDFGP